MSIPEFSDQNPWWKDKGTIKTDRLILAWENSSFKWKPRISEAFCWDANVIYTLRGSRQVGKTTLLRLKIARWFVPKLANAYFGGYVRYVMKSFSVQFLLRSFWHAEGFCGANFGVEASKRNCRHGLGQALLQASKSYIQL